MNTNQLSQQKSVNSSYTISKAQAYYDLSNGKRVVIGSYSKLVDAVQARDLYELSLLSAKKVPGMLRSIARHHEVTLQRISFLDSSDNNS